MPVTIKRAPTPPRRNVKQTPEEIQAYKDYQAGKARNVKKMATVKRAQEYNKKMGGYGKK